MATIENDRELQATYERIKYYQEQIALLRKVENNLTNYIQSVGGFLTEIDRLNVKVAEYHILHSSEIDTNLDSNINSLN
ncbi:MAG: hypothetical protein AB1757_16590 [Acidobacteriota bacterium]